MRTVPIVDPSPSIPTTGDERRTSTPLRAASSACAIVRRIGSMIPSSGSQRAATQDSAISGSSSRAWRPVMISARTSQPRASSSLAGSSAASSSDSAAMIPPIRRNGMSRRSVTSSQRG